MKRGGRRSINMNNIATARCSGLRRSGISKLQLKCEHDVPNCVDGHCRLCFTLPRRCVGRTIPFPAFVLVTKLFSHHILLRG